MAAGFILRAVQHRQARYKRLLAHVLDGVYPQGRHELSALYEGFSLIRESTEATTGYIQRGGPVACPCEGLSRLGRLRKGLAFGPGADASTAVQECPPGFRVVVVTRAVFEDEALKVALCGVLQPTDPASKPHSGAFPSVALSPPRGSPTSR